jgi:hypothetical protein
MHMRRFLVVSCLVYMSVAVIVAIHAIVVEGNGGRDQDAISYDILDRAIRWPIRLFEDTSTPAPPGRAK